MADLELLDPATAAAELSASPRARGFLGLDPVTQNRVLLEKELTGRQAAVFRYGDALVGCRVNADQPRQAELATTAADPEGLRAVMDLLGTYQRCTSYLALAAEEDVAAYEAGGFRVTGRLRGHRWAAGRYHDVVVLHAG